MTDTPNRNAATTARRQDCVTEVRRGEHRPCGFRLLQTGHHRRRQNDESAGSGKRSRTQAAFYRLSHDIEMRSCRGA